MKNNLIGKRTAKIIYTVAVIILTALLLDGIIFVLWMKVLRPGKLLGAEVVKYSGICHVQKAGRLPLPEKFTDDDIIAYMFGSNVSDSVFADLFGDDTLMIKNVRGSVRILGDTMLSLSDMIGDKDYPKHVIIGLDPYAIFLQSCSSEELFIKNISFVTELANAHQGCFFTINLPEDHAEKWNSYTPDELEAVKRSYILTVQKFAECTNIAVYYYPVEEWVLYSTGIRGGHTDAPLRGRVSDTLVSRNVTELSLNYLLTENAVEERLDHVIETAAGYSDTLETYADLSGKKVFFIGDSVFGNYRDETAISSFFAEMTGAKTYNLGQGGVPAVNMTDPDFPISTAFDYLTGSTDTETFDRIVGGDPGLYSYNSYRLAAADLKGTNGKDAIFILEFGLNDYFAGMDTVKYRESINEMTSRLKNAYPESKIIVLGAGYTGLYTFGTETLSEFGADLQTYREITREAALESGCTFLNLATDFDFTLGEIYVYLLKDTVHYNEGGRYRIAQHLARYFKDHT